jgi:hypothetical protein
MHHAIQGNIVGMRRPAGLDSLMERSFVLDIKAASETLPQSIPLDARCCVTPNAANRTYRASESLHANGVSSDGAIGRDFRSNGELQNLPVPKPARLCGASKREAGSLRRDGHPDLFDLRISLIWYGFPGLSQPFQMNTNSILRHLACLSERPPIRDQSGQHWHSKLKARRGSHRVAPAYSLFSAICTRRGEAVISLING